MKSTFWRLFLDITWMLWWHRNRTMCCFILHRFCRLRTRNTRWFRPKVKWEENYIGKQEIETLCCQRTYTSFSSLDNGKMKNIFPKKTERMFVEWDRNKYVSYKKKLHLNIRLRANFFLNFKAWKANFCEKWLKIAYFTPFWPIIKYIFEIYMERCL